MNIFAHLAKYEPFGLLPLEHSTESVVAAREEVVSYWQQWQHSSVGLYLVNHI